MTRARAALAVLIALAARASAQPAPAPPFRDDSTASPTLEVYHVSMGEGRYYFEKFGHNALWFRDPARGLDLVYNWGTFDFAEPGFLGKVLTAQQRYWLSTVPWPPLEEFYRQSDRTIVVQRLNLTPAQATKALRYAEWNARDENKYYRYDYFRDNCSTRVRDLIDLAVDGALRRVTEPATTDLTYRGESLRLVDDMALVQLGINAALGPPSDRPLSVWESMFVPSRVRDALDSVRVTRADGSTVPLVAARQVVYQSQSHAERADEPDLRWKYLLAGLLVAALLAVPAVRGLRSRGGDIAFRGMTVAWSAVTGILGLVILLAWMLTQHVYWYGNLNLLLLNPLALFLGALAPIGGRDRWRRPVAILAVVLALLAAVGLVLTGVVPARQDNLPLILLVLPVQFVIAYGFWRRAGGTLVRP